MFERRYFPASVLDELAYFIEVGGGTSTTWKLILTLKGEVSSQAFREALDACLDLYPKFKCILVKDYPSIKRWFRYCWECQEIKGENILQEIEDLNPDHDSQEAPAYYMQHYASLFIDITRHVPLKVMLIRQLNRNILVFLVHHAAADGIGFFVFIKRFIQLYEEIFYHRKKEGNYSPNFKAISKPEIKPPWRQVSIRHFYHFLRKNSFFRRKLSAPVHPQGGEGSEGKLLGAVRDMALHQFNVLRTIADKHQVTLTDCLLAAMFQAIKQWNQQHSGKSRQIYINVPVNLRPPGDLTVGNLFSGFDISFKPESIDNKKELLRLIREERTSMLENNMALTTLSLAWFLKLIPLPVKKFAAKHHSQTFYPSLSLSNLGVFHPNPFHKDKEGFHYMGSAQICSSCIITVAAPWPQMVITTYNNRMAISLSVYRSRFSPEAIGEFLDFFILELTEGKIHM